MLTIITHEPFHVKRYLLTFYSSNTEDNLDLQNKRYSPATSESYNPPGLRKYKSLQNVHSSNEMSTFTLDKDPSGLAQQQLMSGI